MTTSTLAALTPAQKQALARVIKVVLEAIEDMGEMGAPEGPMFAALMSHGCTFDQFQQLMGSLARNGYVTRGADHCAHITEKGRSMLEGLRRNYPQSRAPATAPSAASAG